MWLNTNWFGQHGVAKPLVWLFNVTLAIIFFAWLAWDGTINLLKKANNFFFRDKARSEMSQINKLKPVLLTGLIAAVLAGFSAPAKAGEDVSHVEARRLVAAGEIMSLEKIVEIAKKIKPGDILETELERGRKSNLYIYEIEILDANGVVWELDINAKTGELMKIELDD